MLLYALTVTFFAIDALMSLNPHWYSTIFGVYFFSGCVVGFFALLAMLACSVQRAGGLTQSVTVEHYHDVGKLAFGFVVFWAYIAFSQYMLIWYANIPEETVWYRPRQGDTWWIGVSLLLLFGHFLAPFLALLSRVAETPPGPAGRGRRLAARHALARHVLPGGAAVAPAGQPGRSSGTDVALVLSASAGSSCGCSMRPMGRIALLPRARPAAARGPGVRECLRRRG